MKKDFLVYFLIFLALLFVAFRSLLFNISTNLPDWNDYPLISWIITENSEKILSADFQSVPELGSFYPKKYTLFLQENLLVQSLLAAPIYIFTQNPVLITNLIIIFTFVLNYISLFLLWNLIFKRSVIAFLGAIFFIFSPVLHTYFGQFQLQSYWPFVLSLYFLLKNQNKQRSKYLIFSGICITLQLLSGVYVAVYLLFVQFAYFGVRLITDPREARATVENVIIIIGVFALTSLPFLRLYALAKNLYGIDRPYEEFATYSAHISDYLFSGRINSFLHNTKIVNIWNGYDKHLIGGKASSPGFLLGSLALISFIGIRFKKRLPTKLVLSFDRRHYVFFLIMFFGFIFSLGPRLFFNGSINSIPLFPYHFFVKYISAFDSIRAPSRWGFLFFFAIVYFSLVSISKVKNKTLLVIIFSLFLIEYFPLSMPSQRQEYLDESDRVLRQICTTNKKAVLEVPVTHIQGKGPIWKGLPYISKTLLASNYHNCYLVNGYGSYDFPELQQLHNNIYTKILDNDISGLHLLLVNNHSDIFIFNKDLIEDEVVKSFDNLQSELTTSGYFEEVYNNVFVVNR
jgi:hypothetical protein